MNKRMVMLLMVLSTACMQGMENENNWSITLHGTTINLTKGFIGIAENKVDMIVLGRTEQKILVDPRFCASYDNCRYEWISKGCGDINIIMQKSREDESASDDDTYKNFNYSMII